MKLFTRLAEHYLVPITLFLGGGGSIIFGISPLVGSVLIILGVLTGLASYYHSKARDDRSKYLMDGLAHLLAKNQLGNAYIEALRSEIRKKGYSTNTKLLVEKALALNPQDREALEFFTMVGALEISRLRWMDAFNKGKYDKILNRKITEIRKLAIQGAKLYPRSYVFHDAQGILLDVEGKHERARKEFMVSGRMRSDAYWEFEISASWGLSKNYGKALEAMERARAKGATSASFHFYYGRVLHAIGECEVAEEELRKAQKEYRRLPEILKELSSLHFNQGKFLSATKFSLMTGFSLIGISWSAALIDFRDALTGLYLFVLCFISKALWLIAKWIPLLKRLQLRFLPPDGCEAGLGKRLIETGYFNLAEKHFRTACKIVPGKAGNFANLAITLYRQGRFKEATEANAIALSIEPDNKQLKHNQKAFESGKIEDGRILVWDTRLGKYEELRK